MIDFASGRAAFKQNFKDANFFVVSGAINPKIVDGTKVLSVNEFIEFVIGM